MRSSTLRREVAVRLPPVRRIGWISKGHPQLSFMSSPTRGEERGPVRVWGTESSRLRLSESARSTNVRQSRLDGLGVGHRPSRCLDEPHQGTSGSPQDADEQRFAEEDSARQNACGRVLTGVADRTPLDPNAQHAHIVRSHYAHYKKKKDGSRASLHEKAT